MTKIFFLCFNPVLSLIFAAYTERTPGDVRVLRRRTWLPVPPLTSTSNHKTVGSTVVRERKTRITEPLLHNSQNQVFSVTLFVH
jgi:hypothetical protein